MRGVEGFHFVACRIGEEKSPALRGERCEVWKHSELYLGEHTDGRYKAVVNSEVLAESEIGKAGGPAGARHRLRRRRRST